MKIKKNNNKKRIYSKPKVEATKIDNEISLVMMSSGPPNDPEYININPMGDLNPFKITNI